MSTSIIKLQQIVQLFNIENFPLGQLLQFIFKCICVNVNESFGFIIIFIIVMVISTK